MSRFTEIKLKMSRSKEGSVIPGLWESDVVRMEAVDGGWIIQVPMREIGRTNFFEFRPVSAGGVWRTIGTLRTREHGCMAADRLQAGTHVLRGGYRDGLGPVPATVVEWSEVKDEIAAHPSTH